MEVSVIVDSFTADKLEEALSATPALSRPQLGLLVGIAYPPSVARPDTERVAVFEVVGAIPCPEDSQDSASELDVDWHTSHAQQVLRSIPGGLHIIGIYSSTGDLLVELAQSIQHAVHPLELSQRSHFIVLQKGKSNGFAAKALPVSLDGAKSSLQRRSEALVEVKRAEISRQLSSITSSFSFQYEVATLLPDPTSTKRSFQARAEGAQKIRDRLRQALDAMFPSPDHVLLIDSDTGRPLPLAATLAPRSHVSVRFGRTQRGVVSPAEVVEEAGETAVVAGRLHLRGYVCGSATLAQVKSALLEDLYRSLYSRIDIVLDEVFDAPEEFDEQDWGSLSDKLLRAFALGVSKERIVLHFLQGFTREYARAR